MNKCVRLNWKKAKCPKTKFQKTKNKNKIQWLEVWRQYQGGGCWGMSSFADVDCGYLKRVIVLGKTPQFRISGCPRIHHLRFSWVFARCGCNRYHLKVLTINFVDTLFGWTSFFVRERVCFLRDKIYVFPELVLFKVKPIAYPPPPFLTPVLATFF